MIDGNQLREEFGRYLAEHKATRWGMDAALMHVCKIAYDAGITPPLIACASPPTSGQHCSRTSSAERRQ